MLRTQLALLVWAADCLHWSVTNLWLHAALSHCDASGVQDASMAIVKYTREQQVIPVG